MAVIYPPPWLLFFQRRFPSANMVVLRGKRPLLVDTGYGSDVTETEQLLRAGGVQPEQLQLIINTHYHCDHSGGNSYLQNRYAIPIAAHCWDAAMINGRDREACSAEWLNQPVEAYAVNQLLTEGSEIQTEHATLRVLHTPGHTLGHIALYEAEQQILICGDVVHRNDVAWLNIFREGAGVIQRALQTLERLASLPLRWACSGHGPAMEKPLASIDVGRSRYEKWLREPEKMAWHACKRILTYDLMMYNGLSEQEVTQHLLQSCWFSDYSRYYFACEPVDFVKPLVDELLRSKAASWQEGRLVALMPYTTSPANWSSGATRPREWPQLSL
ncbi:MAG: hypothetical protein NVS4B7_18000 [Ktedonobacteraceae bacterium]